MNDKFTIIGIDGGASKVGAHIIEFEGKSFSLGNLNSTKEYKNYTDFQKDFKPVDLATQLLQINESSIELTSAELIQSNAYYSAFVDAIKSLVSSTNHEQLLLGIGMPGIKSADGRGIIAMANGPRMPNFASVIQNRLSASGITLAKPIAKLGSDADYCGIGEEFSEKGAFKNVKNAYYLGGGTGTADALKLNGKLFSFDDCKSWIAKTWEFKTGDGTSIEKYCSANGIQETYSEKESFSNYDRQSIKTYIMTILSDAISGKQNALDTWKIVTKKIAELLFERISTIYSGWQNNFTFISSNREKLDLNHNFKGTLLDRIVIGQRLGETFKSNLAQEIIVKPILSNLSKFIINSVSLDNRAKTHYLKNGNFRRVILTTSDLREAPALGAGIDVYRSFKL